MSNKWDLLLEVKEIKLVPRREDPIPLRFEQEIDDIDSYTHFDQVVNPSAFRASTKSSIELNGDWEVRFITDYPDDFKKLVISFLGNKGRAYEAYMALKKPLVVADWETVK